VTAIQFFQSQFSFSLALQGRISPRADVAAGVADRSQVPAVPAETNVAPDVPNTGQAKRVTAYLTHHWLLLLFCFVVSYSGYRSTGWKYREVQFFKWNVLIWPQGNVEANSGRSASPQIINDARIVLGVVNKGRSIGNAGNGPNIKESVKRVISQVGSVDIKGRIKAVFRVREQCSSQPLCIFDGLLTKSFAFSDRDSRSGKLKVDECIERGRVAGIFNLKVKRDTSASTIEDQRSSRASFGDIYPRSLGELKFTASDVPCTFSSIRTFIHRPTLSPHLDKRISVGDVSVIARIFRYHNCLPRRISAQAGNMSLIQSGNSSKHRGDEQTLSNSEHATIMRRLTLSVVVVSFLLLTTLALRFYTDSINDEAFINWNTLWWMIFFVGGQVSGYLILVYLWG